MTLPSHSAQAIDEISKEIIEQLQEDGRRSYAAIGKAVGLSEAAVRQRVQKLVESRVMQIVAVTNPLELGFTRQAMISIVANDDISGTADRIAELPEGVAEEVFRVPGQEPLGQLFGLNEEKPVVIPGGESAVRALIHIVSGDDIQYHALFDAFRVVQQHPVGYARAAVMAHQILRGITKRFHHLCLIRSHGTLGIIGMVRKTLGV